MLGGQALKGWGHGAGSYTQSPPGATGADEVPVPAPQVPEASVPPAPSSPTAGAPGVMGDQGREKQSTDSGTSSLGL